MGLPGLCRAHLEPIYQASDGEETFHRVLKKPCCTNRMSPLNGISYLFWGIAIALPTRYLIHRSRIGAHSNDAALDKHQGNTYVPPSTEYKPIERI